MAEANTQLHRLDGSLIWSGFKALIPISFFVTFFGIAFGLTAKQAGLSDTLVVSMSALVFSGYAQFALIDLWGPSIPLLPMILTALAINARHFLMGATLYPWLRHHTPAKQYGVMTVASDANWALSLNAFNRGQPGLGILLGGGIAIWVFWTLGTWLGVHFGNAIASPRLLGLDMVMGCFLLAMVMSGQRDRSALIIWTTAAASSLLAYRYMPANSHVIIGTITGGVAGMFTGRTTDD
ncbi:AzlC family ABC transporter permease [Marinobacter oulmenensis]|uniref:Putative branched-subunit amino acid permease n=1 Tax=Marinobacter oulmenensis TaxID=643747 RepID=A0A840U741_9GAMM|nr:AzlC family ABC transporter permease [Marinobacter oulmenensis]MBB5320762.1 putative branched-subunit amino acid permease [Marinobacter oulmenensis]